MAYLSLTANDVLSWASIRALVDPVVSTTIPLGVGSAGLQTVTVPSVAAMYVGAQLIVDNPGTNQEIVTVVAINGLTFEATFTFTHPANVPVYAATFPTGQPNNVLFTQTEMLGYLTEALDDFVLKTRPLYEIASGMLTTGIFAYTTPADAIRMERISRQNYGMLGTTISGPGTFTVMPQSMQGIVNGTNVLVDTGESFEVVTASNVTASSFQATFQYAHAASAQIYPAGIYRLWNVSVTDLDNNNPKWIGQRGTPTSWYEDELNVGQYGVAPQPANSYQSNLWYSQRPILASLTSPLLIPDPLAYIPYYGMLARVFRKDGEMRDPMREQYCQQRYDVGVEIVTRLLEAIPVTAAPGPVQAQQPTRAGAHA